jgi:hypothetical protein
MTISRYEFLTRYYKVSGQRAMEIEIESMVEQTPMGPIQEGMTNGNVAGQVIQEMQGGQGQAGASDGKKGSESSKK